MQKEATAYATLIQKVNIYYAGLEEGNAVDLKEFADLKDEIKNAIEAAKDHDNLINKGKRLRKEF